MMMMMMMMMMMISPNCFENDKFFARKF